MQGTKKEWLELYYGFPYLSDIYSKREWLTYAAKFGEFYGDFGKASDALCDISAYYQYLNLLLTNIPNHKQKRMMNPNLLGVSVIPNSMDGDDFLAQPMYERYEDVLCLIMIISLIERLSSKEEYLTFSEWIAKTKSENLKLVEACNRYNDRFGCNHKFRNFFTSKEFLTKKQKLRLLRSITNGSDPLFCYSVKCGETKRNCMFKPENECLLIKNEPFLKRALNEFANFLYQLRNRFVHNACMFNLADTYEDAYVFTDIPYKFRYQKTHAEYKGFVFIGLSVIELKQILNCNFKKLLTYHVSYDST